MVLILLGKKLFVFSPDIIFGGHVATPTDSQKTETPFRRLEGEHDAVTCILMNKVNIFPFETGVPGRRPVSEALRLPLLLGFPPPVALPLLCPAGSACVGLGSRPWLGSLSLVLTL